MGREDLAYRLNLCPTSLRRGGLQNRLDKAHGANAAIGIGEIAPLIAAHGQTEFIVMVGERLDEPFRMSCWNARSANARGRNVASRRCFAAVDAIGL